MVQSPISWPVLIYAMTAEEHHDIVESQCPGSCHLYLRDAGALFQRNIGSLEGLYGEAVSIRCEALLAEEMYDVIGTDLHNERYSDFFDGFGFNVSE